MATACTNENQLAVPDAPDQGATAEAAQREILLTFDNKPAAPVIKAEQPIATPEESNISSLDVYVFASDQENEGYSFQQLLYYRQDASQAILQDWASSFTLLPNEDGKSSSAILKLKKGLFIKLYCIANQTKLRVPDRNNPPQFQVVDINTPGDYFSPLTQTQPGQLGNLITAGQPTLEEFEKFTTPLLDPAEATDVLVTPLAMVDNSNTAIDMRDMTSSERLKESFRLTRLAVRFDMVNTIEDVIQDGVIQAKGSHFTITNIYMVNGRPGSSLFPVKPVGDMISYPKRAVTADAQIGRVAGCFYTYASPQEDGAYLVLEGKFRINQTESIDVSYPVYFKDAGESGRYLEIQSNHRYTINITAAEDYKMNFNISVADWNATEQLDEYLPDNTMDKSSNIVLEVGQTQGTIAVNNVSGEIEITNPAAGNKFAFKIASNAPVDDMIIYGEGDKWLEKVTAAASPAKNPGTKAATTLETTFTYQVAAGIADMHNLQPVTIKLTNQASGSSREIIVVSKTEPEPEQEPASGENNGNSL